MFRYTICFIRRGNRILLLNRNAPAWMGAWNGVGGKLEPGEAPLASVQREVQEETGLVLPLEAFQDKGCVTWTVDGASRGGMYLFLVEVEEDLPYATPLGTAEGILDWKDIAWILHPENKGIAHNVPYFLPFLLEEEAAYEHCCYFTGDSLTEVVSSRLEPAAGQ